MRAECRYVIAVAISTAIIFGQQTSNDGPTLLTVCQVLGDMNRYADKAVAVVGRMERSVSVIDHYEFLSQEGCERPANSRGGPWAHKIQIWTDWEEGMPKPPSDRPKVRRAEIAAKLSTIRKTTHLGSHEEPRFKSNGRSVSSSTALVPNDWAVVYGRIVKVHDGDEVQLMIVAQPDQVRRIRVNGTFLPDDR
jgi:hypothetical protein